jgi:protein SCO1/2
MTFIPQFYQRPYMPFIKFIMCTVAVLSLTACGQSDVTSGASGQAGKTVTAGQANIGGAFSLVNQDGERVSEEALIGQPHLIYFGFTYCPDICPTALQKMGQMQALLGDQGEAVGYIMISVDPERDTVDVLSQYVKANGFPEGLQGFTGTPEEVAETKAAYKVYATKVPTPDSAADYTVDHSDIIYLMGKDGKFVDFFYGRTTPKEMASRVEEYLKTGT